MLMKDAIDVLGDYDRIKTKKKNALRVQWSSVRPKVATVHVVRLDHNGSVVVVVVVGRHLNLGHRWCSPV